MGAKDVQGTVRFSLPHWGSLRFRLTVSVVTAVLLVVAVGMIVDYRREYRVHAQALWASLEEQARGLKVARARIPDPQGFAQHVDELCAQMNDYVSPGHHILVLDGEGKVLVGSRYHSGPEVERALLSAGESQPILSVGSHELAQFRLKDSDGATIIVAQYLDHMEGVLRAQLVSRALAAGAIAIAIMALIYVAINLWVLKPFGRLAAAARRWSQRDFSSRCEESGPSDFRALAREFNSMAGELERHERRRTAELERAREIQRSLLPAFLPKVAGLTILADYRPTEYVAGDLYDVFDLPGDKTGVAILDVSGHGISAALLTGVVKMSLHRRLAEEDDLAQAIAHVNSDLLACVSEGQFVTACVGIWNSRDRTWTYCAAGHPGGMLLTAAGLRQLSPTGPLLGVLPEAQWSAESVPLEARSRLFLYTDGVIEAGRPDETFGNEGLARMLKRSAHSPAAEQIALVMDDVARRNADSSPDDATIVVLEFSSARGS